jgi:hypothetical protein
MRALNQAYEILSDPRRRSMYDLKLRAAQRLGQAASAHGIRRQTSCWRCQEPIDPLVPYCGLCHWLACPKCRSCGCEHPQWRGRTERPPRPGLVLGWALAVIFALFTGVLLVTRPVTATVQPALSPTTAGSPVPVSLNQNGGSPSSQPAPSTVVDSPRPIQLAAANLAVEPSATPLRIAQVVTSVPSAVPTVQPTPSVVPTALPTAVPRTTLLVAAGQGARLRAESSLSAAVLEVLAAGTRLIELGAAVDDAERTWRPVLAPSGNQGWVDARLLEPAEGLEINLPAPAPSN